MLQPHCTGTECTPHSHCISAAPVAGAGMMAPQPQSSHDSELLAPSWALPAACTNSPSAACGPLPWPLQRSLSLRTNSSTVVIYVPWAERAAESPPGHRQVPLLLKNDRNILLLLLLGMWRPQLHWFSCGAVGVPCSSGP